jgi:hypothetical protein
LHDERYRGHRVDHSDGASQHALDEERLHGARDLGHGHAFPAFEEKTAEVFRARHEPDAGIEHDTHVRLAEQSVDDRTASPSIGMSCGRIAHAARLDDFTRREQDFQPTQLPIMIAVRRRADPPLECVAEDAPVGRPIDAVDPQARMLARDGFVELLVSDARLDDCVGEIRVDMQHAVHSPKQDDHRGTRERNRRAVSPIAALPARPHRYLVVSGPIHDIAQFVRRGGTHIGKRCSASWRRILTIRNNAIGGNDVLRADDRAQPIEIDPTRDSRRQRTIRYIT